MDGTHLQDFQLAKEYPTDRKIGNKLDHDRFEQLLFNTLFFRVSLHATLLRQKLSLSPEPALLNRTPSNCVRAFRLNTKK